MLEPNFFYTNLSNFDSNPLTCDPALFSFLHVFSIKTEILQKILKQCFCLLDTTFGENFGNIVLYLGELIPKSLP